MFVITRFVTTVNISALTCHLVLKMGQLFFWSLICFSRDRYNRYNLQNINRNVILDNNSAKVFNLQRNNSSTVQLPWKKVLLAEQVKDGLGTPGNTSWEPLLIGSFSQWKFSSHIFQPGGQSWSVEIKSEHLHFPGPEILFEKVWRQSLIVLFIIIRNNKNVNENS